MSGDCCWLLARATCLQQTSPDVWQLFMRASPHVQAFFKLPLASHLLIFHFPNKSHDQIQHAMTSLGIPCEGEIKQGHKHRKTKVTKGNFFNIYYNYIAYTNQTIQAKCNDMRIVY